MEVDELMAKAVVDLKRKPDFLNDVQRNILRCHELEKGALQKLSAIAAE